MAEDYVGVTEGADKKLRTIKDTIGANEVHDEVISIADPTTITQLLKVNADGSTDANVKFVDQLINADIDAIAETIEIDAAGLGSCGIQITGVWTGTFLFEGTVDGTNWITARAVQFGGTLVSGTQVGGLFFAQIGGLLKFRIRALAWTAGTATIYMEATAATNAVTLANALPTGTNTIGTVGVTDLLGGLCAPPTGTVINELDPTWNADGTIATIVYKDAAVVTLFTLTFSYTSGNITKILRS